MSIFDLITSYLESKEFEEMKLFFDKNGDVCLIEHQNRVTYLCQQNNQYKIRIELLVGRAIVIPIIGNLNRWFIIPNIDKRDDTVVLSEGIKKDYSFPESEIPNFLFEVVNWGVAENPNFKGAKLSNASIDVLVKNFMRQEYKISMKLGEGVIGCDNNLFGDIQDAYKLSCLMSVKEGFIK